VGLYSKKTHFVLELVQNADDNEYPSGVMPRLTIRLTPERIVLVNNETGFTAEHVGSLCSIGESSKAHRKGYIGEKGIADSDYGPPDGCRFRLGPIARSLYDRAAMPVN
jgi:hypothetical protein